MIQVLDNGFMIGLKSHAVLKSKRLSPLFLLLLERSPKVLFIVLHTTYQNLVEKVFIHRKSFESGNEGRKYVARERT